MNSLRIRTSIIAISISFLNVFAATPAYFTPATLTEKVYGKLNISPGSVTSKKEVVVAVIDDGFLLSHKNLKQYWFQNKNEIPNNLIDDDNNGYIDDVCGWDVSDNDGDVSVPKKHESFFYHGTAIAGIIADLFFYATNNNRNLKILPIKALSNHAQTTYLKDGYAGIKYACEMKPDIICLAWSGGILPQNIKDCLQEAIRHGTIVIASVGNEYAQKISSPASFSGVFSVAALDSTLHKLDVSNYSTLVDVCLPGQYIYAPFPVADNAFSFIDGTSPATAFMAGIFAILKSATVTKNIAFTKNDASRIIEAVLNTATPVDSINPTYSGKLGAGIPDLQKALEYLTSPKFRYNNKDIRLSKATINNKGKNIYTIRPFRGYRGVWFFARQSVKGKGIIRLFACDSIFYNGNINALRNGFFVPCSNDIEATLTGNVSVNYFVETIDSSSLYCNSETMLEDTTGTITDGSGENIQYINNVSCKWLITVSNSKKVRIEFTKIDTEPNVDFVYIFDGHGTQQENLLAKFSGNTLPPVISTFTNKALVWFVTSKQGTGDGFSLHYEPTDHIIRVTKQ
jgi:hypothetical protein